MEELKIALQNLDLTDEAIGLYLELIHNPTHNITSLAKYLGTYRRKIYELKEVLIQKGLLENAPDLIPRSPKLVFALIEQKSFQLDKVKEELHKTLPDLLGAFSVNTKQSDLRVFEGENNFARLFYTILDELNSDSEILSYNEGNDLYRWFDLDYFLNIWIKKRIAKKIYIRILANGDNTLLSTESARDKIKYRETRILQNTRIDQGSFWVLPHGIILWDTNTPKAIFVTNSALAQSFKSLFENIWGQTAKVLDKNCSKPGVELL